MYQRRVDFDKNMRNRTINATFAEPLDSNTEDRYREACWAISQFLLQSGEIENGLIKMFNRFSTLEYSTKRSFLEAVYGDYPEKFQKEINVLMQNDNVPKLFAMEALYLFRLDKSESYKNYLLQLLSTKFQNVDSNIILTTLKTYLKDLSKMIKGSTPDLKELFKHQQKDGLKRIYSFQRWNRDYPGLAIVQNANGSFARDANGKLLVFEQLARSASNLPYFLTNGSTPQGAYSIQGTEVSHNNFIGPTPNIQLVMPNETDSVFWHTTYDSTKDRFNNYLTLFPPSWQQYQPITESFIAGKIGRTEIIAHGTTIDPDYFKDKPYYPLTPTMGCLCAKEDWNIFNGKFLQSDQFNLVNTFVSTPGNKGYLIVINLDDQQKAVSIEELERIVYAYEKN
jgi:hypothetical protein